MSATLQPSFVERTAAGLLRVFEYSIDAERVSSGAGVLQRLEARTKIIAALLLMTSVAASRSIVVIAAMFAFTVLLALVSGVPLRMFALHTWSQLLLLTSLIAIPALVLTPGRAIAVLPFGWTITAEGLRNAILLVLRVETIATLAILLIMTTPWNGVLRGLRGLGVPAVVVVIVSMTYRQLFILLQRAHDMFTARRSRQVGALSRAESRRLATAAAGSLLARSMRASEEVYLAMQSRGFSGEVRTLDQPRMRAVDMAAVLSAAIIAALAFWAGNFR